MIKSRLLTVSLLFMISVCCSSCIFLVAASASKRSAIKTLTIEKGNLPPSMASGKYVVLAISRTETKGYDKYLIKGFDKYIGEYEIINSNEVNKEKYEDLNKYRYIFDWDPVLMTTTYTDGRATTSEYKSFYIYDRLESVKYGPEKHSTFFSKTIQAYVKNMNELLE